MGQRSERRVADWNFDRGVEGFVDALHFVGHGAAEQRA